MTATGSHIDFGFAVRGTTLQGKPYATPVRRMELKRAGHAAAPTRNYDRAYRPSSGRFAATFPHLDCQVNCNTWSKKTS